MTKTQISIFQRIPSEPELVSKDMDLHSVSGDLCAVHSWGHLYLWQHGSCVRVGQKGRRDCVFLEPLSKPFLLIKFPHVSPFICLIPS